MRLLQVLQDVFEASGCTVRVGADVTGSSGNTYAVPLVASRGERQILLDIIVDHPATEKDVARLADVARDTNAVACLVAIAGFTDAGRAACAAAEVDPWDGPTLEREIGRATLRRAVAEDGGTAAAPRLAPRPALPGPLEAPLPPAPPAPAPALAHAPALAPAPARIDDGDAEILPGRARPAAAAAPAPPSPPPARAQAQPVPAPPPAAPAPPARPRTDGAFVVGPTLEPVIQPPDAMRRATKTLGRADAATLELVPHRVYAYEAVVAGGAIRRDEHGEAWVDAVSGRVVKPVAGTRVEELDHAFQKVRARLEEPQCRSKALDVVTKALTRRETYERDFGESRLMERVDVAPLPDTLELRSSGEILVPRYRVEGATGVCYVDALTGDLVTP